MEKKQSILRVLTMCIISLMLTGALAACENKEKDSGTDVITKGASSDSNTQTESNEKLTKVTVAMTPVSSAVIPSEEGLTAVEAAINEIAAAEGIEVDLNFYSSDSYSQQINLMMSGGEDMDLMMCTPGVHFSTLTAQNQLADLTDLLDTYAPDLKALIRDEYWKSTSIDGRIRMVTTWDDKVTGVWFFMRKDILEKYGLVDQARAINSVDDIEAIYEKIAPNEPNLSMVSCGPTSNIMTTSGVHFGASWADNKVYDTLGDTTYRMGIVWNGTNTVTNYFESQEFAKEVGIVHDWYNKGWVYKDAATVTEDSYIYVKAGTVFSYFTNAEMNGEADAATKCGTEMVGVMVGSSPISGARVKLFGWGVPSTSGNQEAAVKFLNLLYTNEKVANLINYGTEGTNYTQKTDGTIGFPDGVDTTNTSYYFNAAFASGNYFLLKVWEGNSPTLREDALKVNQDATLSAFLGFSFDNTNVKNEVTATTAVYDEYYRALITGVVDPETVLSEFLNKLKAAGIDDIITEKQKQLDAYLAGEQ